MKGIDLIYSLANLESHNASMAKDVTNIKTFHRNLRVLPRAKYSEGILSEGSVLFCFFQLLVSVKMLLAKPHGPLTLATIYSYITLGTQELSNPGAQCHRSRLPDILHSNFQQRPYFCLSRDLDIYTLYNPR